MERWLLMANCQTVGLANCLNLANPKIDVTAIDIWYYTQHTHEVNPTIADYDRVLIHSELQNVAGQALSSARQLMLLPPIYFDAYHPDVCFAQGPEGVLVGPLRDYQSMIALAAFNAGLEVADTLALYNADIYQRCGYLDAWATARDRLFQDFEAFGYDVKPAFLRWGRHRPFMYSTNHPRIETINDVARLFMQKENLPFHETGLLPSDNLANGPCFPVFPEVGEALGVEGSLLFKVFGAYRYITLEEYVRASFALFDPYSRGSLTVGGYQARFERVTAVIAGEL